MNHPRLPRYSILLAFLVAVLVPLSAQVTPAGTPKPPKVTVDESGWTESGALVLGARIAAGSQRLNLGRVEMVQVGLDKRTKFTPFSMAPSVLVDMYTNQAIAALPSLPFKPFFGSMAGCITLDPGTSIMFGVAFPHPPDPPKDKDGKQLDYKFKLQVPGQEPVVFSLPFTGKPSTSGANN